MVPKLSGFERFLLAFRAFLKIWFDRPFAEAIWSLQHDRRPQLGAPDEGEADTVIAQKPPALAAPEPKLEPRPAAAANSNLSAMHLLSILQRDGRLIDFLQEDLGDAPDADLAAVVRSTVYAGCRRILQTHLQLAPISERNEGDMIVIEAGFDPHAFRLTGNVVGSPPFKGTLKHKGWKVVRSTLPEPAPGYDGTVLAPAEVELP